MLVSKSHHGNAEPEGRQRADNGASLTCHSSTVGSGWPGWPTSAARRPGDENSRLRPANVGGAAEAPATVNSRDAGCLVVSGCGFAG